MPGMSVQQHGGRTVLLWPGSGARLGASRLTTCTRLCAAKYVLVPAGDCSTEHIGMEVADPVPIQLEVGLYELGRAEPADIIIPFPTVSGRHAMLRVGESEVVVTDLGSTNGTYVDGEELPSMKGVPVTPGATVVFGDAYLAQYRLEALADE